MSKEEFLFHLETELTGSLPKYEVDGHIRYYREYLSNLSDEKTEEEKLDELGDPRLIAKTIIDTAEIRTDSLERNARNAENDDYTENNTQKERFENRYHMKGFIWSELAWYQKVFAVIIGILAIIAILGIIILGVSLFFNLILPILIVAFIVKLIISVLRR